MMRVYGLLLLAGLLLSAFAGCRSLDSVQGLDVSSVSFAHAAYRDRASLVSLQYPKGGDEAQPEDDGAGRRGSTLDVIVAELIAIGPGMFVQGLGHRYAGDHVTSRQLMRVGAIGVGVGALGAGLVAGGNEISEDWVGSAVSGAGYGIGVIGVGYYLSAWIYDIYDTPRAVRSGGRPPPNSPFVDSLDFLGRE